MITWILCALLACSCNTKKTIQSTSEITNTPVISFVKETIDIGTITAGESRTIVYDFTNTGSEQLTIDLVTACKCTAIEWPPEPIPPNGTGSITVTFDSSGFDGDVKKTIDIIANTEPIVSEAFFTAVVAPSH